MDSWLFRPSLRVFGQKGVDHLLYRLAVNLMSPLARWGKITFFVRELDKPPPRKKAKIDVTLRFANPTDLKRILAGSDPERSAALIRERFRQGDFCLLAVEPDGQVAHARWLARERAYIPELERELKLEPDAAYFYDGYTRAGRRGQGIDGAVRSFLFQSLRAAGLKRVYSYVRGDNPIGLKAARKWQQPVATLRYLKLPGIGPLVLGPRELPSLTLGKPFWRYDERERTWRAAQSHAWFESWLQKPCSQHSTGFEARPEAYFRSTAEYILNTLGLDPEADRVLDVGCDSAMVSRFVAPHCRNLVAVDAFTGMLAAVHQESVRTACGEPAVLAAADGRFLPFHSQVFTKAYCCAVLHMLASREDGLRIIRELVRVCRPGAQLLFASIPDTGKRKKAWLAAWEEAPFAARPRLLASLLLPPALKKGLRSMFALAPLNLPALDYDLKRLKRKLEREGLDCRIEDFPAQYWSRDFRETRSNLIITVRDFTTETRRARR